MILLLIYLFVSTVLSESTDHPHRVISLPGAPAEPSFPLYSGYINVDYDEGRHNIFYVLCESIRADPVEAPLVVWLNGGPGASSLIGLFMEHGPYIFDTDKGKLRYNDFSWNQYANVLYIESPSGVGFSHTNKTYLTYNDTITANLNMKALESFMTRIHPRYESRQFFITGESYAGAYIPHLSIAILSGLQNGNFTNDNFKGIALGNPAMDYYTNWMSRVMQMFSMGTVPLKYGPKLFALWRTWQDRVNVEEEINLSALADTDFFFDYFHYLRREMMDDRRNNLHAVCEAYDSSELNLHIAPQPTKDVDCNLIEAYFKDYLNRHDVQKSLHVIEYGNSTVFWTALNHSLFQAYHPTFDTVHLYRNIFNMSNANFRIMFYSGDFDLTCPAIHVSRGATIIAKLNDLEEATESPKIWHFLGDFGGAQTSYKSKHNNITMDVLTVRGAGHLVPMNQPERAFQIINNFLFFTESTIDYSKTIRRRPFFKK